METPIHDRPLAMKGLTSYRYKGMYSWIMIGARSTKEALSEAERSISDPRAKPATTDKLQIWNGAQYQNV